MSRVWKPPLRRRLEGAGDIGDTQSCCRGSLSRGATAESPARLQGAVGRVEKEQTVLPALLGQEGLEPWPRPQNHSPRPRT